MKKALVVFTLLAFAPNAFAITTLWSGKALGTAGAVNSSVSGAQSIYFNPAGLADTKGRAELSIGYSPIKSTVKAPVKEAGTAGGGITGAPAQTTNNSMSHSPSVQASYKLLDNLGLGVGYYAVDAGKANYGDVDYGQYFTGLKGKKNGENQFTEMSIGAGYKVMPGLNIGFGLRHTIAQQNFEQSSMTYTNLGDPALVAAAQTLGAGLVVAGGAGVPGAAALAASNYSDFSEAAGYANMPTVLSNIKVDDMKGSKFGGFQLGAQYAPEQSNWGVGFGYRSAVKVPVMGKSSAKMIASTQVPVGLTPESLETAAAMFDLLGGAGAAAAATARAYKILPTSSIATNFKGGNLKTDMQLPAKLTFGGHYDLGDLRLLGQYDFSNYAAIKETKYTGDMIGSGIAPKALNSITHYINQHTIGLGAEYRMWTATTFRAGYRTENSKTPNNYAIAMSPPGRTNILTLGYGTAFLADNSLGLDVAGAYERTVADATGNKVYGTLNGKYEVSTMALHTGISYRF